MEENETYGFIQPLIEVPADVLLYWTMKSVNFEGVVTEHDVSQYHEAICKAYQKYKSNMIESLAFHYPDENNFQHEVFEEVILEDGKIAFQLRKVEGSTSKKILELQLTKLENFERMQKPIVREMFLLAAQIYKISQPQVTHVTEKSSMRQRARTLVIKLKQKMKKK